MAELFEPDPGHAGEGTETLNPPVSPAVLRTFENVRVVCFMAAGNHSSDKALHGVHVAVVGAGVAGLVSAVELAVRGASVTLYERGTTVGPLAASWFAGGMLAPWCEGESAEARVVDLGLQALSWWARHVPGTRVNGTLVVAPPRDAADLERFSRRTSNFRRVNAAEIAAMEPDLEGRFRQGLFFAEEADIDPRKALAALVERLSALGGDLRFGTAADPQALAAAGNMVVDCRGIAAREDLPGLRGVRGEMVLVRTRDITLSRPVRLLHPRFPLYVVPRADGLFMIGATMIETDEARPASVRSVVELLSAAFALHPAFGEAEVVDIGVGVRPSFADNFPQVVQSGDARIIRVNGFYRHGFLLAPAMAGAAADLVLSQAMESAA